MRTGKNERWSESRTIQPGRVVYWNCQPNKWHQPHLLCPQKAARTGVSHLLLTAEQKFDQFCSSFEDKLLQRVRMDDNGCCASETTCGLRSFRTVGGDKVPATWKSFDTVTRAKKLHWHVWPPSRVFCFLLPAKSFLRMSHCHECFVHVSNPGI